MFYVLDLQFSKGKHLTYLKRMTVVQGENLIWPLPKWIFITHFGICHNSILFISRLQLKLICIKLHISYIQTCIEMKHYYMQINFMFIEFHYLSGFPDISPLSFIINIKITSRQTVKRYTNLINDIFNSKSQ